MALTPNPFAHQALAEQREERLARKAAIYRAIGYDRQAAPSLRRSAAAILRAAADRLAQPEPVAAAHDVPTHIHRPEGQPRLRPRG